MAVHALRLISGHFGELYRIVNKCQGIVLSMSLINEVLINELKNHSVFFMSIGFVHPLNPTHCHNEPIDISTIVLCYRALSPD